MAVVKEKKPMGRPTKLPPDAKSFLIRLPKELLQDLRTYAGNKGMSANEAIWRALEHWWDEQPERDAVAAVRGAGENSGKKSASKTRR